MIKITPRRLRAGALVTLMAIAGCEGAVDVDRGTFGWIRGVVVDQAEVLQDSAVVTVLGEGPAVGPLGQTRTDESGRFEVGIHLFLLGPGEYPISIGIERGADQTALSVSTVVAGALRPTLV